MNITLPRDIFIEILLATPTSAITQLCSTNSEINNICRDPQFWRLKIIKDYPLIKHVELDVRTDWRKFYYDLYTRNLRIVPIFFSGILAKYLLIGPNDSIDVLLEQNEANTIIFRQHDPDNITDYHIVRRLRRDYIIDGPVSQYFCQRITNKCYWYDPRSVLSVDFVDIESTPSPFKIGEMERDAIIVPGLNISQLLLPK